MGNKTVVGLSRLQDQGQPAAAAPWGLTARSCPTTPKREQGRLGTAPTWDIRHLHKDGGQPTVGSGWGMLSEHLRAERQSRAAGASLIALFLRWVHTVTCPFHLF